MIKIASKLAFWKRFGPALPSCASEGVIFSTCSNTSRCS